MLGLDPCHFGPERKFERAGRLLPAHARGDRSVDPFRCRLFDLHIGRPITHEHLDFFDVRRLGAR